jgi:E3 ubiquitin-protein ligase RAD18
MRKDFDGKAWMANNKDQFAELIVKARQNAKMRKEAKEEEKADEGQMSNHSARPVPEPAPLTQPSVQEAEPAKPYEGNDQALSIVEEKVEQPKSNGRQLRSWSQALPTRSARGEEIPDSTEDDTSGDCEMDVDPPLYSQYNPSQPPPPSQAQTASSSLGDRKADMFKLPEDPIVDTDGGTAV